MRLHNLASLCLAIAVVFSDSAAAAEPADPPNIVFILADDLGYGDVNCYNPAGKIPTPHIDRLASGGMRFTDAHAPSAVCTPTRYAALTGRYAWRTRLKSGVDCGNGKTPATLFRGWRFHGYEMPDGIVFGAVVVQKGASEADLFSKAPMRAVPASRVRNPAKSPEPAANISAVGAANGKEF